MQTRMGLDKAKKPATSHVTERDGDPTAARVLAPVHTVRECCSAHGHGTSRGGGHENSPSRALRLHSHPSAGPTPELQADSQTRAVSGIRQPSFPSFFVSLKVPFPQTTEMR